MSALALLLAVITSADGCVLETADPDAALVADCASCHEAGHRAASAHPVDLDYASVAAVPGSGLRPLAEVTGRGVRLPGGALACVTCHDPRSGWAYHLALPAGAEARPAVVAGDESTYGDAGEAGAAPPPGAEVQAKPLCLACHAF